jgi:hypothetical protein
MCTTSYHGTGGIGMDWEALDAHFVSLYGHKYTDKMQHLRKRLTEYTTGANSFSVVSIDQVWVKVFNRTAVSVSTLRQEEIGNLF